MLFARSNFAEKKSKYLSCLNILDVLNYFFSSHHQHKQSTALCAPRHHSKLHHCAAISRRHTISPPSGGSVLNATKMTLWLLKAKADFGPTALVHPPRSSEPPVLQPHLVAPCVPGSAVCSLTAEYNSTENPPQPHSVIGALAAASRSCSQFSSHCPLPR